MNRDHMKSQDLPEVKKYLESGNIQWKSAKIPAYGQAGV